MGINIGRNRCKTLFSTLQALHKCSVQYATPDGVVVAAAIICSTDMNVLRTFLFCA